MLIISKVFTILCLLCLCGNREYPGSFQNKAVKAVSSSFKLVPKWSEREGLFILFLLQYYACGNMDHPGNFQNKSVNLSFNWVSRYILFFAQTEWKRQAFFGGCKKGHQEGARRQRFYNNYLELLKKNVLRNMLPH